MPFCEQVLNYGSGNVHIMDPVSEIFRINNSGSGNIVVEDLESSEVRIRNSSWGKVIVTGYTGSINIKNTSIGTVDCYSLLGQCATVRNESSGRVVINVTDWAEIWSKHYYSVEVFGNGANNVSWYPLDDD